MRFRYRLRSDGYDTAIQNSEELRARLSDLVSRPYADIWVVQDLGEMRGFERTLYRLLGLTTHRDGTSAYVLANEGAATIVFLDEDANEKRVFNPSYRGNENEKRGFVLRSGEIAMHPAAEVVPAATAIDALIYFFENDEAPPYLGYR